MKTVEYLDACKEKLWPELGKDASDYQLSKALGVTRSALSAYRNNGVTFSRATAKKVAKILGVSLLRIRADAEVERARSPEERELWRELAAKIVGVLAIAGAGALLMLAGPAEARFNISKSTPTSGPVYALAAIRRWLRALFAPRELAGARP